MAIIRSDLPMANCSGNGNRMNDARVRLDVSVECHHNPVLERLDCPLLIRASKTDQSQMLRDLCSLGRRSSSCAERASAPKAPTRARVRFAEASGYSARTTAAILATRGAANDVPLDAWNRSGNPSDTAANSNIRIGQRPLRQPGLAHEIAAVVHKVRLD